MCNPAAPRDPNCAQGTATRFWAACLSTHQGSEMGRTEPTVEQQRPRVAIRCTAASLPGAVVLLAGASLSLPLVTAWSLDELVCSGAPNEGAPTTAGPPAESTRDPRLQRLGHSAGGLSGNVLVPE